MKSMLVLLLFLIVQGDPTTKRKEAGDCIEHCLAKSGLDLKVVQASKKTHQMPPKSKEVFSYLECCARYINVIRENGTLDYDFVRSDMGNKLPENQVDDILNKCWQYKQNVGESIYLVYECVLNAVAKLNESKH